MREGGDGQACPLRVEKWCGYRKVGERHIVSDEIGASCQVIIEHLVDRTQHLVPSPDGDDALVSVCEPGEGFRVIISLCDEAAYGGLRT